MYGARVHFWFTAQTGTVEFKKPESHSNYYRYRLPVSCLGKVTLEVERARVGSSGLEYSSEFLEWLAKNDLGTA